MNTKLCGITENYDEVINEAAALIAAGEIVSFPTETVYGLGADAMNEDAVKHIFEAKGRPQDNPLIVHIADKDQLCLLTDEITDKQKALMDAFWQGPFTIILKKKKNVPGCVTAGLDTVAVRMPANKVARDLIKKSGKLIAAPSANLSGKPSPTTAQHVYDDLNGVIPMIIDGGACDVGVESTVCGFKGDIPLLLRPGGVTAEMIKQVCGDIIVHDAVLGELKEEKPASPGMKYKHYAPKAEVEVFLGDKNVVAKSINMLYDSVDTGSIVFCLNEHSVLYQNKRIFPLGKTYADAAKVLFAALRDADAKGYKKIFFHGLDTQGEGLAVMNRIIRAAGHNVKFVSEEVNF